jgi:hypothetical protein
MANRDQIEAFMKNFPSQERILSIEPEDLGTHMLKYMMGPTPRRTCPYRKLNPVGEQRRIG